jgi:hypothetical protein
MELASPLVIETSRWQASEGPLYTTKHRLLLTYFLVYDGLDVPYNTKGSS